MADLGGLQTLVSTLQNVVQNLASLTKQIATSTSAIFPQTQGTATTASAGSASLPSAPVGFIEIRLPDGTTAKVPYYGV